MPYLAQHRLPHLLSPTDYFVQEPYERETQRFLTPGWHVVATTAQLSRPGDFVTRDLLGTALQIRNFGGRLQAVSNVCAHRHCLITSQACGNSPTMRCQYHGWEYGVDGQTRAIPSARNFAPFEGGERTATYRTAVCGQLVFVSLAADGPDLPEFLGDFYKVIEEQFGDRWHCALDMQLSIDANWKVVIENSLEAYHVPCVHPNTFRCDPGDERSVHELGERRTSLSTSLPFSPHSRIDAWFQNWERRFVRFVGGRVTGRYEQHHLFPNLLFSFTDAISLCHCVIPTGARTCRSLVWQFGVSGGRGVTRWACRPWSSLAAWLTRRILLEDADLYPAIQQGLQHSQQRGVLGRCEERIHAFQRYLTGAITEYKATKSAEEAEIAEDSVHPDPAVAGFTAFPIRNSAGWVGRVQPATGDMTRIHVDRPGRKDGP